jgi:hypothetical protein
MVMVYHYVKPRTANRGDFTKLLGRFPQNGVFGNYDPELFPENATEFRRRRR